MHDIAQSSRSALAVLVTNNGRDTKQTMLNTITHLKGFAIRAIDGELGSVEHLYFDDDTWTVRYLTVDTGGWLGGRRVLISPFSISNIDWRDRIIDVSLTRQQVQYSPDIDTHKPISRQHETAYLGYFGYPSYWGGPYQWGPFFYPKGFSVPNIDSAPEIAKRATAASRDSHLRSTGAVHGYHIQASDGAIGHISGFVLDDATWAIRYLEADTTNWLPGKTVLISPAWIQLVSWAESKVYVTLSKEAIQGAPEYADSYPITREYENRLYSHYGIPPYWQKGAELTASLSLINV
jgi:hypothetical protein